MNSLMRNRYLPSAILLLGLSLPLTGAELVEKIVARVNDRLITHSEFEKRVENMARAPQAPADREKVRQDVLKDLIQEKLLEERARELDVSATDEEIENAVERIKRQYNLATDAEFDAALQASDMTRDDLKKQMRHTITLQKVIGREVTSRLDITDDALRLEYERQKDTLYKVPEQARISEIVVRFSPDDPGARERAVARIEEARKKVAGGTPFADVAKEFSEGTASERGGDLGVVARGELLPGLDAAVFGESPQEYTAPVLLPGSVHLFRVIDKKPAGYRPFAEVREDLQKRLSENIYDKRYAEYMEKLRREAFVKIYDPALAKTEEKKAS
jgi:peptidyl-prolyl cis-trans isomerase SurA